MARRKRKIPRREARQRAAFRVFACVLVLLTLFGLTRVSLSARVAEAAVDSDRLRTDIRAERLVSDELEVTRGVLRTPERLATIASVSMCMAEPTELAYMELADGAPLPVAVGPDPVPALVEDDGFTFRTLLAAVMDMAAGEAEVLLVGDVGLASSR